jgi:hypothetical protein
MDSPIGWAWKGARSDDLSVEQDVGQGTESLSFAIGQLCKGRARGRILEGLEDGIGTGCDGVNGGGKGHSDFCGKP